jgi:integrase
MEDGQGETYYENRIARLPQRKKKEVDPAEIASVRDVKAALRGLEKYNPKYALALALGCFAGLRSSEIFKHGGLLWEDIDLDEGIIVVRAASAKTRDRREVKITDNLRAWLETYQQDSGRIAPAESNFRSYFRDLRATKAIEWPVNGARHSFATYTAKIHGNRYAAEQIGHKGGMDIFAKHYSGTCKTHSAEAYFKIELAPAKATNVIELKGATA